MDDGVDVEVLMRYVKVLENAITIAADEFAGGDAGYGQRIIGAMASRITMAEEAAAEAAADRRSTLH